MRKLAIMQPYFFPYLGYWQLIKSVDKFVIFDDVNYIMRGWVNRNQILVDGHAHQITMPLQQASQNRLISEIMVDSSPGWRTKLLKTIRQNYQRSHHFFEVFEVLERLILLKTPSLSVLLGQQLQTLSKLMGIETSFITSSSYRNSDLSGTQRIIDICKREGTLIYINAPGGRHLYKQDEFSASGIELRFLSMRPISYPQKAPNFFPNLSIIDMLMSIGFTGAADYLDQYDLES